jgi:PAS domain S-box-containing protein
MKEISHSSSSESPLVKFPARSRPEREEERLQKIGTQPVDAKGLAPIGSGQSWGVLGLAFLVMAGTGVIINVLSKRADEDRRSQGLVVQLQADAHELEALEWKTIFKRKLDGELSGQLEKIRSAMDAGIGKLRVPEPSLPQLHAVAERYQTYVRAVDEEFRLLAEGKIKEAEELDAAIVDPAFDELDAALAETGKALDKQASRTLALVRAGTFLVLLAAVGFVASLFWHYHQRRRAWEASAAEQRFLNLLRAMTEGTTDAIFAKDRDGRYLMINTMGARVVGKTPEEMIGLDDTHFFSEETATRIIERDRAVIRTGETRTDEDDLTTTHAGLSRVYLTTKGALYDSAGAIIGLFGVSRDITERKRAEEALRESEERFRELAENIDEVFWIWTANLGSARLLYVSPAYATIWGRSCESLYSSPKSWKEALHPEDKASALAAIAGLDLEKMSELTYRIVRPDHSIRWISDRIFPVRDDRGVVVRFAGIARDITKSKTTEMALKNAEEQYHSIFNNAVNGIFRTSPDGRILVANPAAARIYGFASPEEMIRERRDIAQQGYVDPRRREEFKRLIEEQGVVNGFEHEAYRKDGSRVWISENTRAVRSPEGEVLYFEGTCEDVTDRKRAEVALRESETRTQLLVKSSNIGLWDWDLVTNEVFFSAEWKSQLGYAEPELENRYGEWQSRLHPDDLEPTLRALNDFREGRRADYDLEFRLRHKDGSWRSILTRADLVRDAAGGPVRMMGCHIDITARKREEEKLEGYARLLQILSRRLFEVQEEERRHLARELHDEVGQTLTAAKINTDMLRAAVSPALAARLDENAAILDRLVQMTRRISLDLRPPLLDDLGLVPALRWYVNQQAERAGLKAEFLADPLADDVPPHIQIVGFRLAQEAITNVVRHADATTFKVELRRADTSLRLVVRDDGKGFDVPAAKVRAEHGASLGLLGLKERAALAGGNARVISTPGQGATVEILLPLGNGESAMAGQATGERNSGRE